MDTEPKEVHEETFDPENINTDVKQKFTDIDVPEIID